MKLLLSLLIMLVATSATCQCNLLVNGDFEDPAVGAPYVMLHHDKVPGWKTTARDGIIEIWKGMTPAAHGKQLCEINANMTAAIWQDILVKPGTELKISFQHRGRATRESLVLEVGKPEDPLTMLGRYTTGTDGWKTYETAYKVPDNVKFVRIQLRSEVPGSIGNLVDNVVVSAKDGGNVNMAVSPHVTIKAGKTVDLKAMFDNPHAIERVNWLGSNQQTFEGSIITVSPLQTTTYLVRAWDVCGHQLPSKAVTVTVNGKAKKNPSDSQTLNPAHLPKEPAANNIVLVLDISSSMALYERMSLTKETVRQLIGSFRKQDRLTVIVFNFGTEIIQQPVVMDANAQRKLLAKIDQFKAGGGSNGEKALQEAYTLAEQHFITGGNNKVYLVSDGAFSYNKKTFGKEMKSRKKAGIALGIVAIQPRENTFAEMNKIINISGGDVVIIKNLEDAKALKEQVMGR